MVWCIILPFLLYGYVLALTAPVLWLEKDFALVSERINSVLPLNRNQWGTVSPTQYVRAANCGLWG